MKFGIMLPHYRQVASTEGVRRVALEAEAMGYHSVWVSEHIVVPYDAEERFGKGYYDPFAVLGYVSAITERVLLGTSIIVLPLRDPLHLAQVAATVDQLSQGRLIMGVGVGSTEGEFRALGANWEERGAVADEAIEVLKHAWTEERPDFRGRFKTFSDVNSYPPPVQKPHPPIWVGGGSARSIRRAAEHGVAWHPSRPSFEHLSTGIPRLRELTARAGRDPASIEVAVRHPMKITDRPPGRMQATTPSVGTPEIWPLVDTPGKVAEGVGRFQEMGVEYLVMDTFYSIPELHDETVDSVLTTVERFAREVMSQF